MRAVVTLTINPAIDVSTSVDRMTPEHKLRGTAPRYDPGGGGLNVARVVSTLGGKATAVYPLGGATGQLLRRIAEREGIGSAPTEVEGETRLSFTVLETTTGKEYRFVLPGPALRQAEWEQCIEVLQRMSDRPDFLVLSGSLPPGVPDDFYARIAALAKAWRTRLVVDTSGPPLAAALKQGVHLIKPNLRELRELTGQPLDDDSSWLAACRSLVEAGQTEIVALTAGHRGALLVTHDTALRAAALPIQPASTVGAGDSFLGALVWALAAGRNLEEAFRYGIAAGSAALLTPGTGLCRLHDIERLLREVTVAPA